MMFTSKKFEKEACRGLWGKQAGTTLAIIAQCIRI